MTFLSGNKMLIEKIDEKIKAIQVAESCINTVLSINPKAVDPSVFGILAELKLDLVDVKFEEQEIWEGKR